MIDPNYRPPDDYAFLPRYIMHGTDTPPVAEDKSKTMLVFALLAVAGWWLWSSQSGKRSQGVRAARWAARQHDVTMPRRR